MDATPFVLASGEEPLLTVDETVLGTNATANFGGNFSSAFGADGAGSLSYAVGTSGGESGLVDTATGEVVNLINNGGVIEGRTSGSNDLVFTVTVNSATGEVTLDQIRAVVHPTDDPNEPTSLSADNLVTVTGTIIDKDGDTQNATLNIGSNLVFLDDGPSISVTDALADANKDGIADSPIIAFIPNTAGAQAAGTYMLAYGSDGAFADSSLQLSDSLQLNWLDPLSGYSFVKDVDGQASTVYVAYKTGDSTKPLFQVLVKNDGTYEFTLLDPAPSESNAVSNVLAGISGGSNLASYTIPGSAFNNDFSLLLTATDNKGASTLTISSTELGIGGNTIKQQFDEVLKVDIQPIGSGGAETIILDKVSVGIANTGSLKAGDSFILTTYYVDPDANGPILPDVDSETVVYDGSGELIFEGFLPGLTVDYVEFGAVFKNVNFKITGIGLDYEVITPPGDYSYSFELVAKDGDSDTAADQFTVFIGGDNDGDWGVTPIVLDLDGDGVELLSVEEGAVIDYGQGFVASAWMSSDDALLVYDYNNDGQITEANEFVFTMWGTNSDVSTDMQALAAYFDADANGVKDGVLDANDTAWSYFGAWQDLNVDGVQDEGEFAYLADWDITGIALFYDADSTTYAAADGDVLVYGQMTVTYTDGSTGMAQDVAFAVATVEVPVAETTVPAADTFIQEVAIPEDQRLETEVASVAELLEQYEGENAVTVEAMAAFQQELALTEAPVAVDMAADPAAIEPTPDALAALHDASDGIATGTDVIEDFTGLAEDVAFVAAPVDAPVAESTVPTADTFIQDVAITGEQLVEAEVASVADLVEQYVGENTVTVEVMAAFQQELALTEAPVAVDMAADPAAIEPTADALAALDEADAHLPDDASDGIATATDVIEDFSYTI